MLMTSAWIPYTFFAISFGICVSLIPVIRKIARHRGWIARPSADRWHKKPTALFGGIGITAGVVIPLLFTLDFENTLDFLAHPYKHDQALPFQAVLILGAVFLHIVGLWDDFKSLKPHAKLVFQLIAASMAVFMGLRLHWFNSLTLDTMATLFWIVGITNAYNLIDNMDGLCAGTGCIAALSCAALFAGKAEMQFLVALVLAGSLAAFLIYNFNPASIFMGDCGSLVIGYCLAILVLPYSDYSPSLFANICVPVMIMLVPIADTTLVTAIRLLSGRKASTGGRDHTSHRLVLIGFSEKAAVVFLYGIAALSGISAWVVSRSDTLTSPLVVIPIAVAVILLGIYLSQLRVYPEKEFSRLQNRKFTPILLELTHKRQIILVFLDFVLVSFAYYLAYRLRFDNREFGIYFNVFLKSLPVVLACKFVAFYFSGIYRGMWRFLSTSDVWRYLEASTLGSVASITLITYLYRFENFSKGIFLIDWILTCGVLLATRGSFRFFEESRKRKTMSGKRVVIYGAGRAGELLLREVMNNNQQLGVKPLGFIDDDPLKTGKNIQGFPIMGTFEDLRAIAGKEQIEGILLAISEPDSSLMARLIELAEDEDLFLKRFSIKLEPVIDGSQNRAIPKKEGSGAT